MSEVLGYVSGNAIVAEQDLQKFDGCRVRIAVMDKRPLETERPKRPFRSFGMARGELRYPDDIDFCNDEIAEMFGVNA